MKNSYFNHQLDIHTSLTKQIQEKLKQLPEEEVVARLKLANKDVLNHMILDDRIVVFGLEKIMDIIVKMRWNLVVTDDY